ncbi:MAG: TRAP transporter small permease subunit, partial [Cohaesibacteraceae bacterium]|nr:TRAP transporter small permease subunit [Cohaesibacteraceae bacterium]
LLTLLGAPGWFFQKFGVAYWLQNLLITLFFAVMLGGIYYRKMLVCVSDVIDGFSRRLGEIVAWAAILMVVQQVILVAIQYTFKVSEISFGPFGIVFTQSVQWWSEELRLYNSLLIVMGAGYTFVKGGHVRVDLVFASLPYRARRGIDLFGTLIFLFPMMLTIWKFGFLYAYRSVARFNFKTLEFKVWKFEQSFNPSGFNEVYLFKLLIPLLAVLIMIQGVSVAYRALHDMLEGDPEDEQEDHATLNVATS